MSHDLPYLQLLLLYFTHTYFARRIIFQLCFVNTASSFPPSSFEHSALAFTGTTFSGCASVDYRYSARYAL